VAWSLDFGWVVGPLLGLGVFWAEGSYRGAKPELAPGSPDDAIWDNTFWLNRLLLAIMLGTFLTVLIVDCGRHWSYLNLVGAFACGCLAWAIAFLGITYPHVTERYRQLRRFEKLRYGYRVPSVAFIGPGALLALVWLAYVALHV
jgi:hypothetical protein